MFWLIRVSCTLCTLNRKETLSEAVMDKRPNVTANILAHVASNLQSHSDLNN